MNKVMIQLDINEPVIVDFEEKEGYADVGNYMSCIVPKYDKKTKNFVDIETEEAKAIRLASLPKIKTEITPEQLFEYLNFVGVIPKEENYAPRGEGVV